MRALTRYFEKRKQAGFTLIEMLTSIAIIGIITAVVIQNQNKFSTDLELTNVAYRIALEARQAQVYGIGVRQTSVGSDSFKKKYGLHFNISDQDSLIFFNDVDGNGRYTPDVGPENECSGSECVEKLQFGRGIKIYSYCGIIVGPSGTVNCQGAVLAPGLGSSLKYFDLLFQRPKADALFKTYSQENYVSGVEVGYALCAGPCDGMAVCINSAEGRKKRIVFLGTGQISVENITDQSGVLNACEAGGNP